MIGNCANYARAQEGSILLGSEILAGTEDVLRLGQSFTVTKPVEILSVEVYAKRKLGGSSFQVFLQTFDPWTETRGTPLAVKSVPLASIPSVTAGGWVKATFDNPVSITASGVYAIFVESDSQGAPNGYNEFGYATGDSINGGRLIGPTFSTEVEMMFRLRGTAQQGAFSPKMFALPKVIGPSLQTRYSVVAKRNLVYATISWDTEVGAVYKIFTSKDMKLWFTTPRLGSGNTMTYERSNEYWSSTFIKIQVMPLGDYKK